MSDWRFNEPPPSVPHGAFVHHVVQSTTAASSTTPCVLDLIWQLEQLRDELIQNARACDRRKACLVRPHLGPRASAQRLVRAAVADAFDC